MAEIHPSAVVHPTAQLADDVQIGPFCVVGPHVQLGPGCILHSHVVLEGPSVFGSNNEFYPFAIVGLKSQDLKYRGEPTFLEVGDCNVFRENSTINRSTLPEGKTIIGSHNHFLVNSHVGHDCVIGNHVILSGFAGVAGHVQVGDYAILSGFAAIHQFVRIGEHSMTGGVARVTQDVPPFTIVEGHPGIVRGINTVGLKRRGFSEEDLRALKQCYKKLFLSHSVNFGEAIELLENDARYGNNACLLRMIEFLKTSERGFCH